MDYHKFLAKKETEVLPYFGGRALPSATRTLRVRERLEPGWYRFDILGRVATSAGAAEPEGLERLPAVHGHLVGDWLFAQGGALARVHFLPEEQPAPLSPCRARRWYSGEALFDALEFEGEAEDPARVALEDDRALEGVRHVASTLRAAYGYALLLRASRALGIPASPREALVHLPTIAAGGRATAELLLTRMAGEREAYRQALAAPPAPAPAPATPRDEPPPLARGEIYVPPPPARMPVYVPPPRAPTPARGRPGRGRQGRPTEDNAEERAEEALAAAGADMRSARLLGGGRLEVTFRFMDERFITVVEAITLQVVDAGVCLAGSDRMVTLDSLPSVIREAIDTDVLVITRRLAEAIMGPVEVFFLVGRGGALLWSDASASPVLLPDSRARWEAIWRHREELEEIAHSHPVGPLAFSSEDETTMEALTLALGKPLRFSVVAPGGIIARQEGREERVPEEPWWASLLRRASGMPFAAGPAPEQSDTPST